ncbi:MAG: 1-acyl-sn-glycerol-3-phosphate acyltransferase [Azonexus sp.]|jgi:1-acyl-sn-glycerol-3-phosphate acyltransferase|nr:1-acyl-sn-glycerol-3-phosphate acyltransferase [Betaproteobacteria bacterium]MBK8916725.1 1-acyl-sn-glycerol-3-phosphate acyltransferase [Betaproteobacteria bacterium]MBP6036454.1 1-acyl-sn-glycerol-3-phosphate acyltransferase [Azonexus sp.]MBP6907063.1 1-acyl-sn-glycerol-3-phosphate acyltransferase [Azonexus sp.]
MIIMRSALFMAWVIVLTVVLAPFIILFALLGARDIAFRIVALWRRGFLGAVALILGIDCRVLGRENMPAEPSVMLAKHQSAWETVALQELVPAGANCVFVLKKELLRLPFFGWSLAAMRHISIDRTAGRQALDQVVEQGRERLADGCYVIVFPEGTRVAPGQKRRYKVGGAYLANHVGCKVVPVAHDAGELWPRQAFLKRPGTITVSIGPAFDATGLSEQEINQRAEAWIEGEMRRISPHRYPETGGAA